MHVWRRWPILILLAVCCIPARAGAFDPPYPRVANVFWQSSFDPTPTIEALSRWQVLVLVPIWTQEQLAEIRARNPDVRIFFMVNLYSMPQPQTTSDPWRLANVQYALDHDLFWYDVNAQIASDWPETWMINVTPWGATPPQGHWLQFFADRVEELVVSRPDLDGIYFDNFWRTFSWQQGWRQLDSDCNPTHRPSGCNGVADTNLELDNMWNDALRSFAADIRARFDALSPQRARPLAIITNNSSDYFESLNGTMHEYFPSGHSNRDYGNPYGYNWWEEMLQEPGGYLVSPWNPSPYVVQILNAEADGPLSVHVQSPWFERHKRFCLASTLLSDGYLSLDAGHDGHGSLWWEPEYDHAGRGAGYLGYPLGPATRILQATGPDLLQDGDFSAQTASWLAGPYGVQGNYTLDTTTFHSPPSAARIDITSGSPGGYFKIWQRDLALVRNTTYTLRFWARAATPQTLSLWVSSIDCPDQRCLFEHRYALQSEWTLVETSFTPWISTDRASLDLFLSQEGSAWLDDIELRVGDTRLFRRDFDNGVVLLNVTETPQDVDLGTTLYRLHIPTSDVFDGAAVDVETIAPSDGRILLTVAPGPLPLPDGDPTDAVSLASGPFALSPGFPNPFSRTTRLLLSSARPGTAEVRVLDARGTQVRRLWHGALQGGDRIPLVWDGRDDRGVSVVSGIYLVTSRMADIEQTRKILLLR